MASRATFGGGCFWCLEAAFQRLDGIDTVVSGYAGGETENPTYEAVCSGSTGHAEVIQCEFDADVLSYRDLLEVLFTVHDPTQVDRQGPDVGSQYRSIICYHDAEQRRIAEGFLVEQAEHYEAPIATELVALDTFYPAEDYHQNYFNDNPEAAYCQINVAPKVQKVTEAFPDRVAGERPR